MWKETTKLKCNKNKEDNTITFHILLQILPKNISPLRSADTIDQKSVASLQSSCMIKEPSIYSTYADKETLQSAQ